MVQAHYRTSTAWGELPCRLLINQQPAAYQLPAVRVASEREGAEPVRDKLVWTGAVGFLAIQKEQLLELKIRDRVIERAKQAYQQPLPRQETGGTRLWSSHPCGLLPCTYVRCSYACPKDREDVSILPYNLSRQRRQPRWCFKTRADTRLLPLLERPGTPP